MTIATEQLTDISQLWGNWGEGEWVQVESLAAQDGALLC